MESSNFKLKTKSTNISEIIRNIYLSFEGVFSKKNIQLILNEGTKDYITNINAIYLTRALNNILLNALKYTDEGVVTITIKTKQDNIIINIKDTGIGISKQNLSAIFNRFYQIDNDINESGGSGIGLAFSKEIINLHNGDIFVESELGKGSNFTISLPLSREQKIIKKEINKIEVQDNYSYQKIKLVNTFLIVDDNADMRNYLKKVLKNNVCLEANNGQQAIEILNENTVDFIITDYMMPKMNGLELIKKLNELKVDIPIIMITAKTELESKLEILKLGVQDYLTKPFDKQELLIRIDNLLQNHLNKAVYNKNIDIESVSDNSATLLKEIEEHINYNSNKGEITQDFLCEKFHISKSSLYRHVKSKTGLTPKQFITEIRLQKARNIIEKNPDILLKQLTYEIGFKKSSYFSKLFIERFGYNPLKNRLG